jgi:hypothetical protein
MAMFEREIRRAFERRLTAAQPSPGLRARLDAAVDARGSRPRSWRVAAASAGLLLVGALTFYVAVLRHAHSQVAPVVGSTPSASPSSTTVPAGSWLAVAPAPAPSARGEAVMAYDAARRQVLLFGGNVRDTWTWDGRSWFKQLVSISPPARSKAAMAYDAARQEVVLFGGSTSGTLLADTWIWNGRTWIERHPSSSPSARDGAAITYDSLRHAIVLFGGHATAPGGGSGGPFGDTWIWDGDNWTQLHPANSPPAREMAVMAYDPGTDKAVLFGGIGVAGPQNDTWTWNGTDWVRQRSSQSPPARYLAGMAHDDGSGTLVLFGGSASAGVLSDTWTWDGRTWTERHGPSSPPARIAPAMAYDAANRTVVLFGGLIIGGGVTAFGDTWLWIGPTPLPTTPASPSPMARSGWKTYVSARWGYSIDYPGDWYDLGNAGAPDTEQYFSNETAGAPLGMTAQGVFETIEVQSISTRPCPPPYVSQWVIRRSAISVDGVETTLYVINMTPTGAEPAYMAGVWVTHGGACYSIQFLSLNPETRDTNTSVLAQAIASFKFGS